MPIQFQNIPERELNSGIDARSSENQISPGFVKDLLNADVIENRVRKRKGHQSYAGEIPVRVTKVEYEDAENMVCFTLDGAVALETVQSSPLVVQGRSSVFTSGPFTTSGDTAKYYPSFIVPIRKALTAPSGTLTILGTEHGLPTSDIFCDVVESTSLTTTSYTKLITDSVSINASTVDVSIGYTTSVNRNAMVFFSDKTPNAGASYVHTVTTTTNPQVVTIPASTHNLNTYNIIPSVQQVIGGTRLKVIPDAVEVSTNGDVAVTVSLIGTYEIILSAASVSNVASGAVNASASGTVTITSPTTPWVFLGIYLEQTPGGTKEIVYADSVDYDFATNSITLSFTNNAPFARNFIVFYEYGSLRSNILCVTDTTVIADGTDSAPQLTIWGLSHSEIYPTKTNREGWVNHVDSYRRVGEQRLIAGLGGNLFSSQSYSEASTDYLMPALYPNLFGRVSAPLVIGPVFYDTGDLPARTRGYITADASGTNWAKVTAVVYDAGQTKYTISLPNKNIVGTLSTIISTTSGLEDWVTITGMSYARHEGTFRILQVADGTDEVYIWVENSTNSSDYDDLGVGGQAGIFTDQVTFLTASNFVSGDSLASSSLGLEFNSEVLSSSGSTVVANLLTSVVQVPAGIVISGERTSSLIPMRTSIPTLTPSVENLVRGDILNYTGLARNLRVKNINSDSDRVVSITGDGTTATAVLGSGDTSFVSVGMKVLFKGAGLYSGTQTITEVLSTTSITFDSQVTASEAGILAGKTVEIDEELTWKDTSGDQTVFVNSRRWIPIEAPDDSFGLTPATHGRYFNSDSYSSQSPLRSTTVSDNLYLTNGKDPVFKFDGSSIYRAGLPAWQPGLFLTQDTAATAKIVVNTRSIAYSSIIAGNTGVHIVDADSDLIPVGTNVRLSGSTQVYTINTYAVAAGATNHLVFNTGIDSTVAASGTVTEVSVYRYYFRLNAVDANNNVVISAVTSHQDFVVELAGNAAVNLKLVGLPALDNYDYDRLEVQIYRTKAGQAAPFYLVTTLPMSFNNTTGYINYTDAFADSDLTQLDSASTAIKGAEIPTATSDPLVAKYITSTGNRLVLANLTDIPELDMQIVADASLANSSIAGGTLLIRKDAADTGTVTDMTNRIVTEWKNGFTGTASAHAIGTNQFSFTTSIATGAVPGDWIYLTYATVATTGRDLTYSGWWQIATCAGTTVTINLTGAASASTYPTRYCVSTDPTNIPVLLGVDGNLGQANGDSFDTFDATRRLALAINATMRMTDTTLSTGFIPWVIARSGNDLTPGGRIVVRFPHADTTPSVIPTYSGYSLFINSRTAPTTAAVLASTRVYPSRILFSATENFAEMFDNPTAQLDSDSESVLDINSSDGQSITGIIPFFGQAAFTAAQQAAILVVFKTNSIYLVDLNQKALGNNALQRIETQGLGCTAPYSIAVTKNGIMFANESGIYCLRSDQTIEYIGKFMERRWTENVDLRALELAQGHHYGIGRVYKLSVPIVGTETAEGYLENSQVYVYNHTQEGQGVSGAWGRYDAHPATGWANLGSEAFFGNTGGAVMQLRNTGLVSDYRDSAEGIAFLVDTRPNDYGNSGIRKILDAVLVHYRTGVDNLGTTFSYSVDLSDEYTASDTFALLQPTGKSGIGDSPTRQVTTIKHSPGGGRGIYFSLRLENGAIDESIEIAGLDHRVGGLDVGGILSATGTKAKSK